MRRGKSRRAILDAAREEFGERGYAGARVSRIAARSGVNKQLIYYYFGSKAGLHAAATAEGPAVPMESAGPGALAPDTLRGALARLVSALEERPDIVALAVDRHPAPEVDLQARAWIAQATRNLAATVSRGQGLGYFRDDVDPAGLARQALVSCLGFVALQRHLDIPPESWVRDLGDTLLRASAW